MPPARKPSAPAQNSILSSPSEARFVLAAPPAPASASEPEPAPEPAPAQVPASPVHEAVVDEGSPQRHVEREGGVTIEDLQLPKTIISRLARGVLPPGTQIQATAVTALGKSATVFVNYLTAHADANAKTAGKKTIMPTDVFKALDEIEFKFLRAKLEEEFAKYSTKNSAKRSTYRQKLAATKRSSVDASTKTDTMDDSAMALDADDAPRAKRARTDTAPGNDGSDEEEHIEGEEEGDDDDEEEEEEEEEEDEEEDEEEGGEEADVLEEREEHEEPDEALDGHETD